MIPTKDIFGKILIRYFFIEKLIKKIAEEHTIEAQVAVQPNEEVKLERLIEVIPTELYKSLEKFRSARTNLIHDGKLTMDFDILVELGDGCIVNLQKYCFHFPAIFDKNIATEDIFGEVAHAWCSLEQKIKDATPNIKDSDVSKRIYHLAEILALDSFQCKKN